MAKKLELIEKKGTVKIILDGNEIHGVLGYELKRTLDEKLGHVAELVLRIAVHEINAE